MLRLDICVTLLVFHLVVSLFHACDGGECGGLGHGGWMLVGWCV